MDEITTKGDSFTIQIKSFLNENSFYRVSQDHRRTLYSYFSKNHKILVVNLIKWICFKIGIHTAYILLSQLYKFHTVQISSLAILAD